MTRLLQTLLLAAATVLTGCPICDPVSEVVDDFDRACADGPCGWTTESGSIENAPTFHPSERGMRLGPRSRARRSFTSSGGGTWTPTTLELTARCDAGTILRVSIVGTGTSPGIDGGTESSDVMRSVDVDVSATPLFEVYDNSFSWPFGVPVNEVTVETAGDGGCTIDDVILTSTPGC